MKVGMVLTLLLLTATARGDDVRFAPGVTVSAAVTLVADANGVLQIDRSKPILIGSLTTAKPDGPVTPEPVDPVDDPLSSRVAQLVKSAPTPTNERTAIAELYKMTGALPLSDPVQIREATSILFKALNLSAEWKTWEQGVGAFASGLSAIETKRAWHLIAEGLSK